MTTEPYSILDLCPIVEGSNARQALADSLALAQHAERLGYRRIWLAEHHNMPGIASAATSVVLAHLGNGTKSIKLGAGGIMLPNHSPLVIAEQFGTLEALFPGRIELGLGRAPGADRQTARALRRTPDTDVGEFPRDVVELRNYFQQGNGSIQAIPGTGAQVPIWILGSSLFSAELAAKLGLPYAFASHFAPGLTLPALEIYRSRFQPSESLQKPRTMIGVNLYAADTQEEAELHFTSVLQQFVALRTGRPGKLPKPDPHLERRIDPVFLAMAREALSYGAVGDRAQVKEKLEFIQGVTGADELILCSHFHDHQARLRSYEIAAELMTCSV